MTHDSAMRPKLPPLAECGSEQAIFSVENLSFSWPCGRNVLNNINFALYPGQAIGLCGSNGSGKTTFFRLITGLLRPTSGHVRLGGKILSGESDFRQLRRHVGFVLQESDDQLFFPSVLEDISFGPLNLGCAHAEAMERARESLSLVGLEGFGERLTHNLSGGEKKLVAIAAILAMRPRALLLDEPLNGLDEDAGRRIVDVINNLVCAKVIIAHDPAFLRDTCTSLARLQNGALIPQKFPGA